MKLTRDAGSVLVFSFLLFMLASPQTTVDAFAQSPMLPSQSPPPQYFAVEYTPGPKWIKGASVFQQNLGDHAKYEAKLLSEGKLLLGGPFLDSTGGLAILQAKNIAGANQIEKYDPAFTEGVLIPHIHSWLVIFKKEPTS